MGRLVLVVVALGALVLQLFSSVVYGTLAVPFSLPHALAQLSPFAIAQAAQLDRFPGVRFRLAQAALLRGDPAAASAWLDPLPSSPDVEDLRARIDLAQGRTAAAIARFSVEGDYSNASAAIDQLAARDPVAALAVIRDFDRRLSTNAPEITGEVEWREGQIAAAAALADPAHAAQYERTSLAAYGAALARAPNDEKYLLNYAFEALWVGDAVASRAAYLRATQVVPDSVDAFVGLAVSAAVLGDCANARDALARAAVFAAHQQRRVDPAAAGYTPAARAALTRCAP